MAGKDPGIAPILDNKILVVLIFTLLGILLYQSGFNAPWYLDDGNNIVHNPVVTDLAQAFKHIFKPRGVAYFSFAVNYSLAGMSPYWFRLTNVVIHIGAALLVWRLLSRLYSPALVALFGGLFFLAHPLQTQGVTYIVQRMAGLAAFFFLLSIYLYIRSRESREYRNAFFWKAGALFCAVLSIWSKQNTIFLPVIILFVDYAVIDRHNFTLKQSVWRVVPFLLVSSIAIFQQFYAGTEILTAMNAGAIVYTDQGKEALVAVSANVNESFFDGIPLRYFATQLIVFWLYTKLFFLPYGQMLDYSGTISIVHNIFNVRTLAATAGCVLIFATISYCRLWNRRLIFGLAWILLTMALESSFIPLDPVFEHRMYLPLFGAIIVVYELFLYRFPVRAATVIAVSLLLVFSILTVNRNALWADPIAFWQDNAQRGPKSTRVMLILAKAYRDQGDYVHAEEWYAKALDIESRNPNNHLSKIRSAIPNGALGSIRLQQGRLDEAQVFFERALQNDPGNSYANSNLGRLYYESGQVKEGVALLEQANKLDPLNQVTLNYLKEAYEKLGSVAEAEKLYRRALSANPCNDQMRIALGLLLDKSGRSAEGVEVLRFALQQYPEEAKYFYYYGIFALHAGDENAYRFASDHLKDLSTIFFNKLLADAEKNRRL